MELSQLTMFKVVAEQGSIIQASKLLHCVPSNITNRIKLLEKELGAPLFIRKGRGLVISPSGLLFLSYTNKILSLCQEARRALDSESEPSGLLKIGAIESSATGRLPSILSRYHQSYPSVKMEFSTGIWSQLLSDVVAHKLDCAIIAVKDECPDIERMEIYKEELVLIASPAMGEISTPQDLIGKNIFMWPEGCPYRKSLEGWLNEHQIPTPITNIASYGTILGCVSSGAGVSLVPKGVFEQFRRIGSISGYSFSGLMPIQNYFIWNRHTGFHRAKDKFSELLKNEFKDV
ncbi:LysR family transcriptional regulator [Iodobacter arcticus]|uniref:LysR family transcriptional regulator n=1 Tax=Iodobacter arcticus TaxID=590593 RepID=A0ABW2QV95_9NEIS